MIKISALFHKKVHKLSAFQELFKRSVYKPVFIELFTVIPGAEIANIHSEWCQSEDPGD